MVVVATTRNEEGAMNTCSLPAPRGCKPIEDPLNSKLVFSDELVGTLRHECYFHVLDCHWVRAHGRTTGRALSHKPGRSDTDKIAVTVLTHSPLSPVPTAPTAQCDATVKERSSPQCRVPPSSALGVEQSLYLLSHRSPCRQDGGAPLQTQFSSTVLVPAPCLGRLLICPPQWCLCLPVPR